MIRALTKDHDWTYNKHYNQKNEVAQNLKTRLLSFKSDWFIDLEPHIDWWAILGRRNNEAIIKNEITRVSLATDKVSRITNLEITTTNRNARIILSVVTDFGDINLDFENGI
jgi:hypothetical protein